MLTRIGFVQCGTDTEINEMFKLMRSIRNLNRRLEQLTVNECGDDEELYHYKARDISYRIEDCYRELESNPQYEDKEFCWELFNALY